MQVVLLLMCLACGGYCTESLWTEVNSCLKNITKQGSDNNSELFAGDASHIEYNHGKFDDSVQCLEKIYEERRSTPSDLERLKQYANPKAWQSGFKRLCNNINLYTSKSACVKDKSNELNTCMRGKPKASLPVQDLAFVDIKTFCRFFCYRDQCFDSCLGAKCGETIGAVLSDFLGGLMPPVCRDCVIGSSGAQTSASVSSITVVLFLYVIKQIHQYIT